MNILLVYPEYPNTFWSFKQVLKFIRKKAAFPPLGLLTVSSMLPKDWNKKLVDVNVNKLTDEKIAWADMIFMSAMIVQGDSAKEIIQRCKELGKTVVAGGPVFTTGHERFKDVDHFILNEAESTLPRFLKDFKEGKAEKIYRSEERPDVAQTPLPDWSLIDFKDYAVMPIQYSRGCPFNCEFCDIIVMNGRTPRAKTPTQLEKEFDALYNAGWIGSVFIVDDNFIGNRGLVKKMLPVLIEWQKKHDYPFTLLTEASTNLADDEELMRLMSSANFYKVFLGIETPNPESLRECSKVQNLKGSLMENVQKIQAHGMQVMGGFIVGFDSDTESIFDTQINFIQDVGVVTAMVGMLAALPQTRLWHRLKDEGRLLDVTKGDNTNDQLNFVPKMGAEKLLAGYKKIISTIYSPKQYYERINTLLKVYKPTVKNRLKKEDLQAFIRSMWRIGLLSRSRYQYWKLIVKTFITKRKSLPVVIDMAIWGLHFQKIVRKMNVKKNVNV
ncbi:MAG: DUF4070 domain-containing protein [Candidatus Woesearchaeota archaeon]|jgi:radical SAM superfamily enzyme YgiQ (UPF0313 family)|nr:DUF4070 domain-containing protein [Candidatus Woesearchaeota archaeon]MDP7458487.1 DUF4070 domain-containing protein [Candidatus Woesearchaeota archaeon]